MKKIIVCLVCAFVVLTGARVSLAQSVVVNEFSQGSGGNKEWVELLVVNNGVDMRGWELGDNDDGTWTSILEFTTDANWSSVAAGTLIVIYNGGDIDGTIAGADTDFSDKIVLIPHDNTTFFTDATGGWSGSGAFGNTDSDDVPAIRDAADSIVHDMAVTHPAATVTGPGSAQVKYFIEDSVAEIGDNGNWTAGASTTATPGAGNGGNNTTWVTTLNGGSGDPTTNVKFSVASETVSEAVGTYDVTITKSLPEGNVSGELEISGTATLGGGDDFTISTTNFTMNGATTSATFTITVNDDATIESAESIILTLANINGGTPVAPSTFTLNVNDNDTPPSSLIISEVADPQDNTNVRFVELYNAGGSPIDLLAGNYNIVRQVNEGTSYGSIALTGTVAAGATFVVSTSTNFLTVYGFDADQYDNTISGNGDDAYFLYSGGGFGVGTLVDIYGQIAIDGTGTPWEYTDSRAVRDGLVTQGQTTWDSGEWTITAAVALDMTPGIHPDGPVVVTTNVQFSAASAFAGEVSGSYTVTVTKSLAEGTIVGEVALSGTATEGGGADYTISTTNFTMDGVTTSATFVVTINDDVDTEVNETVILTLANVTGGTIASPSAFTLTITDNDAAPPPANAPWINEIDYDSVGTDSNEWVEIVGPAGVSLNDYELVMINDGGAVYNTFDLAAASWTFADEDNGFGFFVIGLVNPAEGTADYTPAGWTSDEIQQGPADSIQLREKAGPLNVHLVDYEGDNPNTADNQNTPANDDSVNALTSIFLTGGPGSGFASFGWTNTIGVASPGSLNNGQTLEAAGVTTNLRFTTSSASVLESSVSYTVTVVKTTADGNVSGEIALGGTATLGGGSDYTISTTNLTLNGATTSATVIVTINNDVDTESDETVILTLTNVVGGGLSAPSVFTLTITDDDTVVETPPTLNAIGNKSTRTNSAISFAVTAVATEGDPVTLTVSNAPVGSTFGATNINGTFSWASPAPAGVYTMTFYAADNDGADSETITITVTNSPTPASGGMNLGLWLNELHYDAIGGDTNEGFEIAGPAGVDLSDYEVVLYDGGLLAVYSNIPLSGIIPDQSNGFGTIWVDAAYTPGGSLQNGPTDGLALVYNSTGLVQFISYEGSFTPVSGPASGVAAVNIGSLNSVALTTTLQLCGTGTNYAEMAGSGSWITNLNSRGSFNDCQVIPGAPPSTDDDGDLIPNDWETLFFGTTTGAVATVDTDLDGFINIDEYIAGTDPTNGLSFFEFDSIAPSGGARVLEFETVTGRVYQVLWSTNLLNQVWFNSTNGIIGSGTPVTVNETNAADRIYQIRTRLDLP